ncbi:MAG: DMT family transporter, partial [Pseudoruegeria sp.]
MNRQIDLAITAIAPLVWGSTYYVTTEYLPVGYPITMAALRALPAGLILLVLARQLPQGIWWARVFALGALNFTLFWTLLFVAAYRLPGGVAATVGAVQPLIVVFLASIVLGSAIRPTSITAAAMGIVGVGFLALGGNVGLDPVGLAAGLGGAISMGAGTVLTRKWQPSVPLLTFTAGQ